MNNQHIRRTFIAQSGIWHFNLFNNKWGTNFPTWCSDDAMFRFTINFDN